MALNSPNLMKTLSFQIQEAHKNPSTMNMKKITPRYNKIKLFEKSDKEKNLKNLKKQPGEKAHYIQRNKNKDDSRFVITKGASKKSVGQHL